MSPTSAPRLPRGSLIEELNSGLPCGKLTIKLATTEEERKEIFRLRYRIFNEELGEGIPENQQTGLDQDEFDKYCDHLMVLEDGEKVVGTYRLLFGPKRPPSGFYSETEFSFKNLKLDFNKAVELGRGCIEPQYRKQTTLMTLFWGIHRYMEAKGARYLLGCGSLPKMSSEDAEASFLEAKKQGRVNLDWDVNALKTHQYELSQREGTPQIPSLIDFYFRFGAKVLCRPAFDSVFGVYDFLLLFDMQSLTDWGAELLKRFDERLLRQSEGKADS